MKAEMTDRNLLFGLIAMQSDLIEMRQFVDACTLWGAQKDCSLADVLVEQGWLIAEDREHVEYPLNRHMKKVAGDVKRSLAGMPDSVKVALESIDDEDIQNSLSGVQPSERITTTQQISSVTVSNDRITRRGLHSTGGIGHVIHLNDQTERLFGYARDELIGQRIEKLIPERFRAAHPKKFSTYAESPHVRPMGAGLELYGQHKNGMEFSVEISLSPLDSEDGQLYISAIRDMTDRRRTASKSSGRPDSSAEGNRLTRSSFRRRLPQLASVSSTKSTSEPARATLFKSKLFKNDLCHCLKSYNPLT